MCCHLLMMIESFFHVPVLKEPLYISYMSYWRGPYGVYVPSSCRVVPEPDGNCNNDGSVTEVCYSSRLTEQEYHKRYCKFIDGKWVIVRSPPCESCGFKGYQMQGI